MICSVIQKKMLSFIRENTNSTLSFYLYFPKLLWFEPLHSHFSVDCWPGQRRGWLCIPRIPETEATCQLIQEKHQNIKQISYWVERLPCRGDVTNVNLFTASLIIGLPACSLLWCMNARWKHSKGKFMKPKRSKNVCVRIKRGLVWTHRYLNTYNVSEVCVIRFDSLGIKGLIPSCGAAFCYISIVTTRWRKIKEKGDSWGKEVRNW